jgi:SAM-dependent methyltransferase
MKLEISQSLHMGSPAISAAVQAQYQTFPYPHYSLWLPLRTQEAFASHSGFVATLATALGHQPALGLQTHPKVLMAGCGDVFPYFLSRWEPATHRLFAVDLSSRSLARARFRTFPLSHRITWRQGNLEDPQLALPPDLSHIDCYGVLHHLADPRAALHTFYQRLAPGGTLRLMVYNRPARSWIHHLQSALKLFGLSPFSNEDIHCAQELLKVCATHLPCLKHRFHSLGPTWTHASRFVDTFMHQREARLDLRFWWDAIQDAGFDFLGLYDRYGELDDLPNPLWQFPAFSELQDRMADRRFENNLEMFLIKPNPVDNVPRPRHMERPSLPNPSRVVLARTYSTFILQSPPSLWFEYPETKSLPWMLKRKLWWHFLNGKGKPNPLWTRLQQQPALIPAFKRLARIGAIAPEACVLERLERSGIPNHGLDPLYDSMEVPQYPPALPLGAILDLRKAISPILQHKRIPTKRFELALLRIVQAQVP